MLSLHIANLAVCGTGLVYAWMRYLVEPTEEWAVVNHPWQPHLQHLHVLAAPLLVFAVGLIWSAHVVGKLKNGSRNRVAGIGLIALFLPMAASGYLLQAAVEEVWRQIWIWVHVVSSLLWVAAFVVHQFVAWAAKSERALETEIEAPLVTPYQISARAGQAGQFDVPSKPQGLRSSGPRAKKGTFGNEPGTETETEAGTGRG
jgi:hypothetical protein